MSLDVTENVIKAIENMGKKVNRVPTAAHMRSELFETDNYKHIAELIIRTYKEVYIYQAYTVLKEDGNWTVVRIKK